MGHSKKYALIPGVKEHAIKGTGMGMHKAVTQERVKKISSSLETCLWSLLMVSPN